MPDVRYDLGLAIGGDPPGHALAERHAGAPDLVPVEPVRRGEGQVRLVAVEEVEGGDIRVERVAGLVDDGLEQLVPGPRGRGQAHDAVEEPQLVELLRAATRGHAGSATRITIQRYGPPRAAIGCGGVERMLRLGPAATSGRRSDAIATRSPARSRLSRLLGQVLEEQAGPSLLATVERTRRRAVRARTGARRPLAAARPGARRPRPRRRGVIRAFTAATSAC